MNTQPPVLIVGAGPTGLMMACELARRGISFRIIDKKSERTQGSNATWIQPRTIELFDDIGMADVFLKQGHICNAIHLHIREKDLVRIPLDYIDSTYKFILMLPQSETEKLLSERLNKLNHKIERSAELIEVTQNNNQVISKIKLSDNKIETITSQWLIACDGANSTVRENCGIFFSGENLSEQFMVADAHMDSFIPRNEIHVFFDKGTLCGVFPMKSNHFRINANLHQSHPRMLFIDKEVKEIINERTYGSYNVNDVSWISPFWIHGKVVDNMRHGSIFLAGDAAHIHSPAGGQGMNVGLQDAYNLAWKLALVINGKAKPSLLDSYQSERCPVVNDTVNQTDSLTKMALFDHSFLTKLRKFSHKIENDEKRLSKKIGMQITQLNIQYQDSPIIDYSKKMEKNSPRQGKRAPDVAIDQSTRLYDHLRNTDHNILLFAGLKPTKNELDEIKKLQQWLDKHYSDLIRIHIIAKEKLNSDANIIVDANDTIHKRYHINSPAFYIIRPDKYIACCSMDLDHSLIKQFFSCFLK